MAANPEVENVLKLAKTLVVANYRVVMEWFEKAVQVTLKYEMELDPKARRAIAENLQEAWGAIPIRVLPPLTPPGPHSDPGYVPWIMDHIMYLTHPVSDSRDDWVERAFFIMNECREHLGLPKLDKISA